jgi:type IV pilus assembly protein PilF
MPLCRGLMSVMPFMPFARCSIMGALLLSLGACASNVKTVAAENSKQIPADPVSRARIHTELAALYFQQGGMKIALEELANAVRINPDYAPAYSMYGLVYMQLGEQDEANRNFQKAVALAPNDPDIRNNYGLFLCETQQYQAGLNQLDLALSNPLYATPAIALVTASRCAQAMGNDALAKSYRQRAAAYGAQKPAAEPAVAR